MRHPSEIGNSVNAKIPSELPLISLMMF